MSSFIRHDIGLSAQQIDAVRAPLSQASLLPAQVYSDPAIFAAERERIFARSWLPVCHISQIAEPGAYVARILVGEAVIAVRGREGEIRVMSNVCRHRNTVLTSGTGQCGGNRIICPYHGWTYGLDGKLLAAPFMDQIENFARREVSLPQFRHEVWNGFVFVNFDVAARSISEELADFQPIIGQYHFEEMEAFEIRRFNVPWNWKISLENFSEAYHQPWVHPQTAEPGFPAGAAIYHDTNNKYSWFSLPGEKKEALQTFRPPVAGLDDFLLRSVTIFNVYPYMHGLVDPATPVILDFDIRSENDHDLIWTLLMPKGSRQKPNIEEDVETFASFLAPVWAEDIGICTSVGQGVHSRFTEQGRLSHMEKPIHQFHNWWLDRMLTNEPVLAAAE